MSLEKTFARTYLVNYNWQDGLFSYKQRITANQILASKDTEPEKIIKLIECFGGKCKGLNLANIDKVLDYTTKLIDGMVEWNKREAIVLAYEQTADEKKYGYSEISKTFGEFCTVDKLAKTYSKTHSEIEGWDYILIFTILAKDLAEHKLEVKNYERTKNNR